MGMTHGETTDWTRSCRFAVEVDGKPDAAAAVFERRGVADLVGVLPDGTWFLVRPNEQKVYPLSEGSPTLSEDGQTATLGDDLPEQGHHLTLTPSGLTFDVSGHWLRVIVTPPLVGEVTVEDFLAHCPEFRQREQDYEPSPDRVQQIAAADGDLRLEIFFGSWCAHCQEVLPQLFKCLRLADNPKLQVRMIGLPRSFGREPEVQARAIRGVPTVIVMRGNTEVGRFSASQKSPIEDTLAQFIGG
jgi:thiol-disulfide isomerase/thioredoxin